MNVLIKPVFFLMNQLSYRGKFMMISSVFAIPLAIFAAQLAYTFHQEADQAERSRAGLVYLTSASHLIRDLETIRDSVVVASWQSSTFLNEDLGEIKKRAYRRVLSLIKGLPSDEHGKYLFSLRKVLENDEFIRGNESERIDGVYEDAHLLIKQAYSWRAKLSYAYISSDRGEYDVMSLLNLLNESDAYTHDLGQVRAFGSLYIGQRFIESHGVEAVEKSYASLTQTIDFLDVKRHEYAELIGANPDIALKPIEDALIEARELLYIHLIESMSPTGDARVFYAELTALYDIVDNYNLKLLSLSERLLEHDYEVVLQRLFLFYLSLVSISIVLLYLSAGVYRSIGEAMNELSASAALVASGNYDKAITIGANDELRSVAEAMDQMRLSIKEREEKLEQMSQTDGLTQLFNRPFFDRALEISLANSRRNLTPLTLVMMDVDYFKAVNDTYGHQAGDECLKSVANLMQEQYQRKTDVVARYGGEEFIVILYGQTLEDAIEQTEKLRLAIENNKVEVDGQIISFTASFGLVSLEPPAPVTSSSLVARADELLYEAKNSGRNCLCSDVLRVESRSG